MCGIVGQINRHTEIDPSAFDRKRDTLIHRGPDDAHSWTSGERRVALGFRRLSFLDLSVSGRQPMCNEKANIWLVCNGEIYNYIELKNELESLGHQFKSQSDSEVILHGYEEWGTAVLPRLKGMFAFGIWEEEKKKLFLAKDRFGIKPLYYGFLGGNFHFASELKAILAEEPRPSINKAAIPDFLNYRYIPAPGTIWEGLYKLAPAHFLELEFDNDFPTTVQAQPYWHLHFSKAKISFRTAVEQVDQLIHQSVAAHLRSDVPVGSFLSGGYDSSALVHYMTQQGYAPNTFSIGFDNWSESEHQYAELVAQACEVPFFKTIVGAEQLQLLDRLMYYYDEPIADISIIPTYMVSQLASQHNKTVFSGEGADEIFGGYWWQKQIAALPAQKTRRERWKIFFSPNNNFFVKEYAEAMAMGRFDTNNLPELLHPQWSAASAKDSDWFYRQYYQNKLPPLKAFQYMDMHTFMTELILVKIDRASMAHSLEVRVPFLDHELVEWVYGLPTAVSYQSDQTKVLLRENIKKRLPKSILNREKQGFVGPDTYYMNYEFYANTLRGGRLIREKIVRADAVEQLLAEKAHWKLWKLAVLEFWWNKWM